MNYCPLEEIKEQPLVNFNKSDLFYLSDGRTFTQYKDSNYFLQKLADKINIPVNSNEFRLYIQKNPDELRKIMILSTPESE